MKTTKIFTLIMFTLLCYVGGAQTKVDRSFTFQSVAKKYSILIPSSYNSSKASKMMVGMHPLNTNRWDAKSWRDTLSVFANTNNLLLVCPDGGSNGNILDQIDTAFTTALIDSMFKWYNIDSSQVYIMGFSWGGKATYVYGMERPDLFAGYMPVGAATQSSDLTTKRKKNVNCKPVAVIHGANDAVSTRYTPMINALKTSTNYLWDTLLSGVGHTIDFNHRNALLSMGFAYIDSINNLKTSVNLGKDLFLCGRDSVNLGDSIVLSGGRCSYTYSWSPSSGLNDSTIANPRALVSTQTTYILTVLGSDGQQARDTIILTPRGLPKVVVDENDTLCQGVGKLFKVKGAKTYKWSPTSGLSCTTCDNPSIKISKKSVFYVTGTDSQWLYGE